MRPRRVCFALLVLAVWIAGCALGSAQSRPRTLIVGWYPWDPYNYADESTGYRVVTGLDVELTRAALANSGHDLEFVNVPWDEQMAAIGRGDQHLAMGALPGEAGADGLRYSTPYRTEVVVLFVRAGAAASLQAADAGELLGKLREQRVRVGASTAYSYGAAIDRFLEEGAAAGHVRRAESEYALFRELQLGRIDGFIADRLVGATVGWRTGLLSLVEEHPTRLATNDVRIVFGAGVPVDVVAAFDEGMARIRSSGEYNRMVRLYVMPLLLAETVQQPWFGVLNAIATIALSVSGVILAYTGRFSMFGAFVLASLPSLGGGVLRDLLVGRRPIGIVREPELFALAAGTVLAGWAVIRFWPRSRRPVTEGAAAPVAPWFGWTVTICDALGLGTLTVIGVLVAMETRAEPLVLWGPILAVTTTVGGGVMRDLVRGGGGLETLKGSVYPEIAIGWGVILSLFFYWEAARVDRSEILLAVVLCAAGAFATRVLAVAWHLRGPMLLSSSSDAGITRS